MYNLKTTSLSSRFYAWIWQTEVTKFKTMCPYFWAYVFTILILPIILIGKLLYYLLPAKEKVSKSMNYIANSKVGDFTGDVVEKIANKYEFWYYFSKAIKWLYIIVVFAVLLFLTYKLGYSFYYYTLLTFAVIGGFTMLLLTIAILYYVFDKTNILSKIGSFFKLCGRMIYSLYKNVCPMVKWE